MGCWSDIARSVIHAARPTPHKGVTEHDTKALESMTKRGLCDS